VLLTAHLSRYDPRTRFGPRQVSLSGSSDEIDHGVAQHALLAGPVLAVSGVHVDGRDPGPATQGRHEPDCPAAEPEYRAVLRGHRVETFAFRFEHGGHVLTYSGDTGESSVLAELAASADVLTHLSPDIDPARSLAAAAGAFSGPVSLAAPGQVLDLG
jgi:ribonuclease BN (tRNA processing enzyme)